MAKPKLVDLTNASPSTLWRRANPELYKRHVRKQAIKIKGTIVPKDVKKALTLCYHSALNSSKVDNRPFSITKQDLYSLWILQDGKCNGSKMPMQTASGTVANRNNMRVSIDRIKNHLGYTKGNIQLVVWQFNNAKGAGTMQEAIEFCKAVAASN
jgi:hypothetical protein